MNIDSLALYMTFLGLLAAIYQLRQKFLQQRMVFKDSISKEYFDITFNLDSVRLLVGRLIVNTCSQNNNKNRLISNPLC